MFGSKCFTVGFFEFSRDKLSCRIFRLEHSHRGISSVVRVSEIKVEKRVN